MATGGTTPYLIYCFDGLHIILGGLRVSEPTFLRRKYLVLVPQSYPIYRNAPADHSGDGRGDGKSGVCPYHGVLGSLAHQ